MPKFTIQKWGPQVAVGAVVRKNKRVLLIRRAHAPARGKWTLPGGRVHFGEKLEQALIREVYEETGLRISVDELVEIYEHISENEEGGRYHYVIIDYLCHQVGGELRAGDDADAAHWFAPEELETIPVTASTLQLLRKIHFID